MANAKSQVNQIINKMHTDVAAGMAFTAPVVALKELGLLSLNRLFAFRTLRAKSFKCELCTRRTAHEHNISLKGEEWTLNGHQDIQTALDLWFGRNVFKVSNPLFGGTINIKFNGVTSEMVYDMRYFLIHVCGINVDVAKSVRRKVAAVVKI